MLDGIAPYLPPVFAFSAVVYLALAVRVARTAPDNLVPYFLFLIGCLVAGAAFSGAANDETIFGIGRVLSFFAAGFIPVVFYTVYREYTSGRPGIVVISLLSLIFVLRL